MEKDQKRSLKKCYLEADRQREESKWPFEKSKLRNLVSVVRKALKNSTQNCSGDLSVARQWAKENALDENQVVDSMIAMGGCCDCQILLNVYPNHLSPKGGRRGPLKIISAEHAAVQRRPETYADGHIRIAKAPAPWHSCDPGEDGVMAYRIGKTKSFNAPQLRLLQDKNIIINQEFAKTRWIKDHAREMYRGERNPMREAQEFWAIVKPELTGPALQTCEAGRMFEVWRYGGKRSSSLMIFFVLELSDGSQRIFEFNTAVARADGDISLAKQLFDCIELDANA